MNPTLLDRFNEDGALTNIAACGGLIATAQFGQFARLRPRTAQRALKDLADFKMVRLVRARQRPAFVVLTRRTVDALGTALPRPPGVKGLRLINYQLGLARAECFLQRDQIVHSTSDLITGRTKKRETQARIKRIVDAQQAQLKRKAAEILQQLKVAPTQALREQAMRVRRHLRGSDAVMAAGLEVLRHRWGLFLADPTSVRAQFMFVDRATPVRLYEGLVEMLARFSAATSLRTSLEIVCGSEISKQRVEEHLAQMDLRVQVEVVNLEYDRYLRAQAGLPALVGRERIAAMLSSARAREEGA